MITSPWFPNPYEDDKHCLYDIEAPLGKAIVLNFTDFSIEDDCDFDSLNIYDGIDSNSTLIGTYCGSEKPPAAISTLNHLHLEFKTDSSNTGPGFRADYSFIDAGTYVKIRQTTRHKLIHSICRLWRYNKKSKFDNFTSIKFEWLCFAFEVQMDHCSTSWIYN